jgi:hypothetical protein
MALPGLHISVLRDQYFIQLINVYGNLHVYDLVSLILTSGLDINKELNTYQR